MTQAIQVGGVAGAGTIPPATAADADEVLTMPLAQIVDGGGERMTQPVMIGGVAEVRMTLPATTPAVAGAPTMPPVTTGAVAGARMTRPTGH